MEDKKQEITKSLYKEEAKMEEKKQEVSKTQK